MEERIDASLSIRSVTAWIVAGFSGISVLLAAFGIYGLTTQVVTERTAEIGIRMALGGPLQALRDAGLPAFFDRSRDRIMRGGPGREWLRSFLYQIQPLDPATLILCAPGVLATTIMAVLTPSWRASRVDPQTALRSE